MPRKTLESIPTRESLLGRLKDWEDQDSWRDFYDTYWRLIHRVALKAGLSEAEADDALQDTVVAVAHEIKKFTYDRKKGSFKGWLLQQTRWQVSNQFRKRQKRVLSQADHTETTSLIENLPDPASVQVSPDLWDEEWHRNLLAVADERVKAKVEPRTFQMYQLSVRKQWSIARVAKSLGVSRARVYVARHRIDAQLKKEMRRLAK